MSSQIILDSTPNSPYPPQTGSMAIQVDPSTGRVVTVAPSGVKTPIGTTQEDVVGFLAAAPAASRDAVKAAASPHADGGTASSFAFHCQQITITDGPDAYGREYHAFPDLTKIGETYWITYMTAGAHADRRGDTVVKSSTDCRTWTTRKIFAASKPSGTIVVGDFEYRAGNITDLGQGAMVCILHKYNVIDSGNLSAALGNVTAWSLSTDSGETWTNPVEMDLINPLYYAIGGMTCAVWKGNFYVSAYSNNAAGGGLYIASIASLKAGVPVWSSQVGDFGQEPCVQVNPSNSNELMIFGRRNDTFISVQTSINGTSWSGRKDSYYSVAAATNIGSKPLQVLTQNGNWVVPNRVDGNGSLQAQVLVGTQPMTIYSADGNPDDELWPVSRYKSVPNPLAPLNSRAWSGVEKNMYFGAWPLGGDLVAMVYALEPQEQYNAASSSGGHRSSIVFGFFGAGTGITPLGPFSPAVEELSGSAVSLATAQNYRKWMEANTEFSITNGEETIAVEILGDFVPTFSSGGAPITPTGAYNANRKNVAIISPGPSVTIINSAPPSPMEIVGLKEKILVQLSPSGIQSSGGNVTGWTNEGLTNLIASYTPSPTAPTVSNDSTPNGNNSVQGALGSYFDGPATADIIGVYALAFYPTATWSSSLVTIYTNAIQADQIGTATWKFGTPFVAYNFDIDGVKTVVGNPTGWHVYSARIRSTGDGTGTKSTPATSTNTSRLMGQPAQANRGWDGKLAAFILVGGRQSISNREDYLIRRWMRSL